MKTKCLTIFVGLAMALTALSWFATINRPFALEHAAWADAHMALMARAFAREGILNLHAVPIQNNPPISSEPDTYIHWPPLFAILLSLAFDILGESLPIVHGFVMLVNLIYLIIFWRLVNYCLGKDIALASLFGIMVLPIFIQFSPLVWTVNAGLGTIMLAIYCFLRGTKTGADWRWLSAGIGAVAIGTWLSWEPILLGFALLALALWQRSKPRIIAAGAYALTGVTMMCLILTIFVVSSPGLRADLLATARYRMGGVYQTPSTTIHALVDRSYFVGQTTWRQLAVVTLTRVQLIGGSIGLVALAGLFLWTWEKRAEKREAFFAVGGLMGVWVGWFVLFPNHAYVHAYQWLLAAPLAGMAIGSAIIALSDSESGWPRWLGCIVLPSVLLVPLVQGTREFVALARRDQSAASILNYANEVRADTPPSAVVLSSYPSMVPVYYSQRHVIRYVNDEETLRVVNQSVRNVFPQEDVYLAIQPSEASLFPCASSRFPTITRTDDLILLKDVPDVCK
jgi:hypothetical protein